MRGEIAILALVGMLVAWSAFPAGASTTDEPGAQLPEGAVPDEIVIGFHGAIPANIDSWVGSLGGEILMVREGLSWISVKFETHDDAASAIDAALERVDVRWAEHDGYVTHMAVDFTPNDPLYGSQWGFPAINAPEAWDIQMGSHDVNVAILDTGVEGPHADLAANICGPHESFVPGEPALWDGNGHGTHVAGTVAAVSDNGIGVAGTSQSCLMDVKVLNSWGSGQWTWVAGGIEWAADNGADIISMSLGGGLNPGMVLQEAVAYAALQGSLIIAAAGNSGCFGGDTVIWPAQYPGVMAVASLASPGTVFSGFSSCGPAVEIAAPGSAILSTWRNGGYHSISGTSMATPHVSGVAALVMSEYPVLTGQQVRCVLALTADDVGSSPDTRAGWGRVNAERAVTLDIDPTRIVDGLFAPNGQHLLNSCTPEALNAVLTFTA